jgi:anaerobic magnesium-protoporphyrin IX monomethyl ester cyclase
MSAQNNKRIIFVNPNVPAGRRYGPLASAGANEPPLGLCYLAAFMRQEAAVEILDAQALGLDIRETAARILDSRPDYLGISASTMGIRSAGQVAEAVKRSLPSVRVVLGGCHASAAPAETLRSFPGFDAAVAGEGEETFRELFRGWEGGQGVAGVAGAAVRDGGTVRVNPARGRIKDLDSLPVPAFDLLPDLKAYYRLSGQNMGGKNGFSLVTSRGCPGRCTFCDRSVFGNEVTLHSAGYVVEMVRRLRSLGVSDILFEDDNFALSRERVLRFSALMREQRPGIRWSFMARADSADAEMLAAARAAGCWQVSFGIESGSRKILDLYRKGITPEQARDAVRRARAAGLRVKCFFMWGNPGDDAETVAESMRFIRETDADDISITFFTPFPGAELWGDARRYGDFETEWDRLSCFNRVFTPAGLSAGFVESTRIRALRGFYLRPRVFLAYVRRLRSLRQAAAAAAGLRSLVFTRTEAAA